MWWPLAKWCVLVLSQRAKLLPHWSNLCNIARSISFLAQGDHARASDAKNTIKEIVQELQKRTSDLSPIDEYGGKEADESKLKRKVRSNEQVVYKKRRVSIDHWGLEKGDSLSEQSDEKENIEDKDIEPHFALTLRDRIISIVESCFEQFLNNKTHHHWELDIYYQWRFH